MGLIDLLDPQIQQLNRSFSFKQKFIGNVYKLIIVGRYKKQLKKSSAYMKAQTIYNKKLNNQIIKQKSLLQRL